MKVYATYTAQAWILGIIVQFVGILGVYLVQMNSKTALSLASLLSAEMISIVGNYFILSVLGLLIAFVPRFTCMIWAYVGFTFFVGEIGNMLKFPATLMNLDVYHNLSELTVLLIPNIFTFFQKIVWDWYDKD